MEDIDLLITVSGPHGTLTWELPEHLRAHLKSLAAERGEPYVREWLKQLGLALALHTEVLATATVLSPLAEAEWAASLISQLQQIVLLKLTYLLQQRGEGGKGLADEARAELMARLATAPVACHLRMATSTIRPGSEVVEVRLGRTLLGVVTPTDLGIAVISKFLPRDPKEAVIASTTPPAPALRIDLVSR